MLRIILITAIRSLLKYRNMSIINLAGLIIGLTSFLFAVHYIFYEFSYDSFFEQSENIYRVNLQIDKENQTIYNGAKTSRALFYALKREIPELESNGFAYFEKNLVSYENTNYANQDVLWVSEDFEKVFPLEMVAGIADYSRPRTGIISETSAKALYGNLDPIGKIMKINQGMPIEITGIFKDLPPNSHFSAQYFASVKTWVEMQAISEQPGWNDNSWWNYIKLKDGASPKRTEGKINQFVKQYMPFLAADKRTGKFSLQPLKDLHFIRGYEGELGATTNYSSLINLVIIALVTLIIAWINYVNLSTAHAQTRIQQIRMRKLIGATNLHIWHQSLAESIILNIAALIVSSIVYLIFLQPFGNLFDIPLKQVHISPFYIFGILVITITAGVIFSSIYHGFNLVKISSRSEQNKGSGKFKMGLVVVQMSLSIIFLICTVVVYRQIAFMKKTDLGISLENVIVCTGPASLNADGNKRQRYEGFESDLLGQAGFQSATFNVFVPGQVASIWFREYNSPSKGVSPDVSFFENNAGHGLIDTWKMKLLAGKGFGKDYRENYNNIIINEKSRQLLGFENPEEAIGQWIFYKGNDSTRLEIIGVVADFHNEGLQKPIYPMVWNNHFPTEFGYFAIRVEEGYLKESVSRLKTTWDRHYSKDNFDYIFADQLFNQQYESESRYSKFYLWLTLLSISISAIGLYGLILFYLGKREKEIGIRKINGAKISQVMFLLNKEIVKWVATAFIIAVPVAWFAMHKWLENFAFKTNLNWWIFALCGLMVLLIALLTVSWQSWKAAARNPVEALRYE